MKVLWKVLETFGILLVQIVIGWAITRFVLKNDWNLHDFVTSPGMIVFWAAYIVIYVIMKLVVFCIKRYRKNSMK